MAISYEWVIEKIEAAPEKNGYTNVVSILHWRVNASGGSESVTSYGTQNIEFDDTITFIPYEDLSRKEVLSWLKSSLGRDTVGEIEKNLSNRIDEIRNPPLVNLILPWEDGVNDRFFG